MNDRDSIFFGRRELSFRGCRTRAEMVAKFRAYLERQCDDSARFTKSSVILRADDFTDDLGDVCASIDEHNAQIRDAYIDGAIQQFNQALDRVGVID